MDRPLTAVFVIFVLAATAGMAQVGDGKMTVTEKVRLRETVFQTDFSSEEDRSGWSEADWATWVEMPGRGMCLRTESAEADASETHMIRKSLDLTRYGDCTLHFECLAKAENVSKPEHTYNGVKFMFHFRSPSEGPHWHNENNVFGTFDWKTLSFSVSIPSDAKEGWFMLGLQESSGLAFFDDIRVTVAQMMPRRPAPDPNAPPPYRGHHLSRLHGVMSPNSFRDEDLRTLGQDWNANLIRWQMTTHWGAGYKHEQDYDLEKYTAWLDAELTDLDKVLDACRKYGIMAVIDLHSPPGGRRENRDLVLIHEPKYLDAFVSVWEKIARRYKGNPAVWGYDLVNEPVQNTPPEEGGTHYLDAEILAAKAIRRIDPDTTIIFEVDHWDGAEGFKYIEPVDIPNVVYQVHMYYPGQFTHQGVHGSKVGVVYPGEIGGRMVDKETLRKHLEPVRVFQQAYNVHIYVGEFSAIRWAPGNSAYQYLRDAIDIFEEYGWDWSYHAFREWDGWSLEHGSDPKDHSRTKSPSDRMQLLLSWFQKNEKPW